MPLSLKKIVSGLLAVPFLVFAQVYAQDVSKLKGAWKVESELIHNLSNTPAEIEVNRNGKYMRLSNRSSKTIIDFRFGCISRKLMRFVLVSNFEPKAAYFHQNRIAKDSSLIFGSELSGISDCLTPDEQLTITELKFEDDSIWKIADHLDLKLER